MSSSKESIAEQPKPLPVLSDNATWFEKMGDAIMWKVVAPDFHNPYQIPFTDRALVDLSSSEQARLKACDVRVLCDGYEVLSIKNLYSPQVFSSHPCISVMPRNKILDELKNETVAFHIKAELEKLQFQATEELSRRQAEQQKECDTERRDGKTKLPRKPAAESKNSGTGVRVVRM